MKTTLVLIADAAPMTLIPISAYTWQEAIQSTFSESFDILETYDNVVARSPSIEMPVPSVIMSRHYVNTSRQVKISRENIKVRDEFRCQYCGEKFRSQELTMDHVHPKKMGGQYRWDNIVSACERCNSLKGHRLDIRPIRRPTKPSYGQMIEILRKSPIYIPDIKWNYYLHWPENLVNIIEVPKILT